MKQCEIRVVTPGGRDNTTLAETFRRLGYPVTDANNPSTNGGEITVLDARASDLADWAEIERDLGEQHGPAVVISDDHVAATAIAQRAGRPVVFASGESDMGYSVAIKLCALLRDEQLEGAAA